MFNRKHPHNIRPSWGKSTWTAVKYFLGVLVVIVFFGGLVWMNTAGCPGDREEAYHVVEGAGYTKIEIGGPRAFKCGRDDTNSNTFTAIGPNGHYVEGVVCCSFLGCAKGCTLRFE